MKELSIEQKAKAYDEAIERANSLLSSNELGNAWIYKLLPELKESEDEKIKEELKKVLDECLNVRPQIVEETQYIRLIDWLEKHTDTDNKFIRMRETKPKDISEFLARLTDVEQEFLWEHIAKIRELDKEEKNHADKVGPKFKVGDTVKDPYGDLYHITEIIDDSYKTDDGRFILFKNQEVYTLFNFTAWSEEDDRMYNRIVSFIPQHLTAESYTACINWFKDLKDRVQSQSQWKPSDEQMRALSDINLTGSISYAGQGQELVNLYNDLKNLK
jgi:hemerythrin